MDGMVAVVRGLRDAGLAVTLLDNGKQFTLAPNCYNQPVADESATTSATMPLLQMQQGLSPHMSQIPHMPNMPMHMPYSHVPHSSHATHASHTQPITHSPHASHLRTTATDAMPDRTFNNSATQAIDGRYASTYQNVRRETEWQVTSENTMMPAIIYRNSTKKAYKTRRTAKCQTTVCKMKPTNPPVHLTEFPPQRPGRETLPGQDNFIVGGTGSGDTTYSPVRIPNNYRGGLCWTDRRSVCSPRPSRQPDAFASSLRKYPTRMSPDRSSEIVERLITYTQAKNYGKSPTRYHSANSQTRSFEVDQMEDRKSKCPSKLVCRGVDSPRPRFCEESPTREKSRRVELEPQDYKKATFARSYDVRYLRDVSRMVRDNMKSVSCNPYHQPVCPVIRERHDTPPSTRRSMPEQSTPSMVNSEMQAAAQMICREVSTTPRIEPPKRNVAVALTPESTQPSEGAVSFPIIHKSVQAFGHARKSVQTTLSCIEMSSESFISNTKKSKSAEDVRNKKSLQNQILAKLEEIFLQQELKFLKDKAANIKRHAIVNKDSNGPKQIEEIPKTPSECHSEYDENSLAYRRKISKDLATNMKQIGNKNFNVYCAEITNFMICNNHFRRVICDWLNEIPLKSRDFLGRTVNKDEILSYIVCRLKIIPKGALFNKKKFRTEILDIVDDIPVNVLNCNKAIYLNKLAEDLISRLEHAKIRDFYKEKIPKLKYHENEFIVNTATTFKRFIRPSEDEIREFVKNELVESIQNSQLDIDSSKIGDIESDLVEVMLDTLENISNGRDEDVINEITTLLRDSGQLLKNQAEIFSKMLIKKLKKRFFHVIPNEGIEDYLHNHGQNKSDSEVDLKEFEITQKNCGTSKESNDKDCETCKKGNCDTSTSSQVTHSNIEGDAKYNVDAYLRQLYKEIDQWLSSISKEVPKVHDRLFRYMVVRDLAEDVVDIRRYLQFNPSSLFTDKDELEHFKYQIFKWINKVVGENNMATLEKAPDLMQRIRSIPVPLLTKRSRRDTRTQNSSGSSSQPSRQSSSAMQNQPTSTSTKYTMSNLDTPLDKSRDKFNSAPSKQDRGAAVNQSDIFFDTLQSSKPNSPIPKKSKPMIPNKRKNIMITVQQTTGVPSSVGTATEQQPAMNYLTPAPSIKQLNDEYDEFLKNWVQSIPMPPNTDPDLAEKMKLGLYHGIWKAVAKIKSSPATLTNQFYYEDVLDDEIEELFSLVPPTDELQTKKHLLKVQLIEKTSHVNEMIKVSHAPETFGQKLVDSVAVYVPRTETDVGGEDKVKLYEDLKILFLTDEYILYTRYKDEDPIKANVYRSKLLRCIQEFVSDIKKLHNKELKDVDEEMYMNEILTAMQQVPLPSNETVIQEADEVLLGMEIDKWFSDLPLAANNDALEQLKRRRLRDMLAKKMYEMEKQSSFSDSTDERVIRHEVSQILEKLPLGKDESLKINFMVDELTNRIKNRDKGAGRQRKSTVVFNESIAYNDFAKTMAGVSSPIKQQQQIQQQQPQHLQRPGPENLDGSKWITPPSTVIHPQPTSAVQDAAGRMWYSFDQRRPSFGLEDAPGALHQSLGQSPTGGPLPLTQQAAQALAQNYATPAAIVPGQQSQSDAPNQSFWLAKYLEKVEAKTKGYEERGMTTQGLGEAPWPFMAPQPDVCGMQSRQGTGQPGMAGIGSTGQSMGGQGPMGQSMAGKGPMGQPSGAWQSMGSQGQTGQSMGRQEPIGQSKGRQGPMGQSMGGQVPVGQSMGGQGPMEKSMAGQGPMGQSGGAWQSMGSQGQTGLSMGGQGPMGQGMGSQVPVGQSIRGQVPMEQSMGGQSQMGQLGGAWQSIGAPQSIGGQGQMVQPSAPQPGQDTGSYFGPDTMYQSMDVTKAPLWSDQPAPQGAPRQTIGQQGGMPGVPAPGMAPRQSIVQTGARPSISTGRKSVQLIDGRKSSDLRSPGRQSISKRDQTPEAWPDTQYRSMDATKARPAMWAEQPGQPQILQQQPLPQQQFSGQTTESGQPSPNQTESMWLNKYLTEYEAAHLPVDTTPQVPLQQSYQYPRTSIQFGPQPQNTSVLEPPEYGAFNQERPLSSSYQQAVMDRSVGPPLLPAGQVSGMQQIQGSLNASGRPAYTSQNCKSCRTTSSGVPTQMPVFKASPPEQGPSFGLSGPVGSAVGAGGPLGPASSVSRGPGSQHVSPLPFVGGVSPYSAGANQFPGASSLGVGPLSAGGAPAIAAPGTFTGIPAPVGGVSYVGGPAEQDLDGRVGRIGASIQQGVGSGIATVTEAGQQAPGFYRSTDREGIQMFTEQNKGARSTASGTDNIGPYPPAGYYTPEQQMIQGPFMPPRPKKSRGTQRTVCVRRRLDFNDTDEEYDNRCRCLDKIKKFKPKPCFNRECVDMPRPMRYYPPYYACHPPYPYF